MNFRFRLIAIALLTVFATKGQSEFPNAAELHRMAARLAPVQLQSDTSRLSTQDQQILAKLTEAAKVLDRLFMQQLWSGNLALEKKLEADQTPIGRARLAYFWLNKGPWSDLDGHKAFLPGVLSRKPEGANFYPEDMSRAEFNTWVAGLDPEAQAQAKGFFTVIRRDLGTKTLKIVPYSKAYAPELRVMAARLREAAALTQNESLRKFLELRAAAFLSNDYYESDLAWMDLDAPVDVTIGPYETYNDELFGYKASFEAYVNVRDDAETGKLKFFGDHLQEVEDHLPINAEYRNSKLGSQAPIRVVNEVIATGDAAHGVRTAAYNLPNDERVVQRKGSKRVMLKNVQEAKFRITLEPIAGVILAPDERKDLSFDAFFTHILAHELSHGIGPHEIQVNGRSTNVRFELKDLYSAIEEAKADITGLFMLQYFFDNNLLKNTPGDFERKLYTSYLASSFRTMRFGMTEAHGKGMALQFNYLRDKGAFIRNPNGTFAVDFAKIKDGVRSLTHDLLTIEATGDYAGAKKMLDEMGVMRPEMEQAIQKLSDIPVDIAPKE